MLPAEMVILLAIAQANGFGKEALTRPIGDVSDEYITRLYQSLVRRGYLRRTGSREEYQLTTRGAEALIEFLRRNESRVRQTIKALQRLRISIGRGRAGGKMKATAVSHKSRQTVGSV